MNCWDCGAPACAICHECGRALCKEHSHEGKVSDRIHCEKHIH